MSIFEIGEQYELVGRNKKRRKFLIKKKKRIGRKRLPDYPSWSGDLGD